MRPGSGASRNACSPTEPEMGDVASSPIDVTTTYDCERRTMVTPSLVVRTFDDTVPSSATAEFGRLCTEAPPGSCTIDTLADVGSTPAPLRGACGRPGGAAKPVTGANARTSAKSAVSRMSIRSRRKVERVGKQASDGRAARARSRRRNYDSDRVQYGRVIGPGARNRLHGRRQRHAVHPVGQARRRGRRDIGLQGVVGTD